MKLFRKKRYRDKYLTNLIIKAGNLAQMWHLELKRIAPTLNVERSKRILNHIYRIAKVQQQAQTRLYDK